MQPEWMAALRVGDVLVFPGDVYRVVREVSRWERVGRNTVRGQGPVRFVTFAIRRRSWTNRCYTLLTPTDLLLRGARPVGARIKLTGELDAKISAAIRQPCWEPFVLRADDVRGIA